MKPKRQFMKSKSIAKLPWAFQTRVTPLQHITRDTSPRISPTKAPVMVKSLPKVVLVKNNAGLSKAQSMRRNFRIGEQLRTYEQAIANSTVLGAEKNLKTQVQSNNVQQRNKEEKKVRRQVYSMDFDSKCEAKKSGSQKNKKSMIAAGLLNNQKINQAINKDVIKAIKDLQDLKQDSYNIMNFGYKNTLTFSKR
jgi:hypothetical protein